MSKVIDKRARSFLLTVLPLCLGALFTAVILLSLQSSLASAAPRRTVTVKSPDMPVVEGDEGDEILMLFTLELSSFADQNVTVTYQTVNGSAFAGQDYTAVISGELVIPAGSLEAAVPITVTGDYVDEADENFYLKLTGAEGVDIGLSMGEGQIIDDDTAGFEVEPEQITTSEAGTSAQFSIRLTSQPTAVVTVLLSIGAAYLDEGELDKSELEFTPQEWNQPLIVTVTGKDDSVYDGDIEYEVLFEPAISNDPNYNGLTPKNVQVVNLDTDVKILLPLIATNHSGSIFVDRFDKSSDDWEVISVGDFDHYIKDSKYYLRHTQPNFNVRAIVPDTFIMPAAYSVEVKAGASLDQNTKYGIIFDWLDAARFYRFIVDPQIGQYFIQKYENGYQVLASGNLLVGFDSSKPASLRVERDRASIRVYLNDQCLDEINDTTYPTGRAGLIMVAPQSLSNGFAEAFFDDFVIEALPQVFLNTFLSQNSQVAWEHISFLDYETFIQNDALHLRHSTANYNIRSIAPIHSADIAPSYLVQVKTKVTHNPDTKIGIVFDWLGPAAFYRFLVDPEEGKFFVQKYSGGYVTIQSGNLPPGFDVMQFHELAVKREGDHISVYIDGNLQTGKPIVDNTYMHGQVGVIVLAPADLSADFAEAAFDYFEVKIP